MRLSRWAWMLGLVLLCATAVRADDPIGRFSFGGSGGFSTYALESINDRIRNQGNHWLDEKGWNQVDPLEHGWSFWGDLKFRLPLDWIGVEEAFGVPLEFFATGGFGISSGTTGGRDYNELIEVQVDQTAAHARLLYVVPWRFHEDVRIFFGGGPLFISEQKVTATHTSRSSAGGGGGARETERTEEVTYVGDGAGLQLGLALEYLLTDRMTLAFDLGYRWASVDFGAWSVEEDLTIEDTDIVVFDDGTTSLERLHRTESYVFHGFLDAEATERAEELIIGELHTYGPHMDQLQRLTADELDIDMSGIQVHLGFRFYVL